LACNRTVVRTQYSLPLSSARSWVNVCSIYSLEYSQTCHISLLFKPYLLTLTMSFISDTLKNQSNLMSTSSMILCSNTVSKQCVYKPVSYKSLLYFYNEVYYDVQIFLLISITTTDSIFYLLTCLLIYNLQSVILHVECPGQIPFLKR